MSTLWVTSDTHAGHAKRMPELRGFASIEEHDDVLRQNWNRVVRKQDTVIHFGDVGCGAKDDYILEWVSTLNGSIQLITGNHDSPWPGHRNAHKHQRKWMTVFDSVQAYAARRVGTKRVMMSHLPYVGDHTKEIRYPEFRLPNTGALLLHGHVHDKWKVRGNQINVGVDVWNLRPVMLDEVIALAKDHDLL
jgi:calcineurin-like phosphoesterase family protein